MKQLLEAGVHFGHQKRRWNPKMQKYIYTDRNDIYIIDLKKTLKLLREACVTVRDMVAAGKEGLFVGTKKQARDAVVHWAQQCNMHYINNRWLGGILTNWETVQKRVARLIELDRMLETGEIEKYSKKEQSRLNRQRLGLKKNLEGVKRMKKVPGFLFVIDPQKEHIAVHEANKMRVPIVGIVDTNCDPDPIDIVIPANDDAIRAINLVCQKIAEACIDGMLMRVEAGLEPPTYLPESVRQQVIGAVPEAVSEPQMAASASRAAVAAPPPGLEVPLAEPAVERAPSEPESLPAAAPLATTPPPIAPPAAE